MKYIGSIQSQANAEAYIVASGAIANGKPCVVNSNGTVSAVNGQSVQTELLGTKVVWETATVDVSQVTYDSNSDRVVIAYQDSNNSSYTTAIVGQVDSSDNSITFGTPVVFNSADTGFIGCTFDSNSNRVLIAYRDGGVSDVGRSIVGSVDPSDNSIAFGTEVQFESGDVSFINCTFDSNVNRVVISYKDDNNSNFGTAVVGSIDSSDNSIAYGTPAVFDSQNNSITGTDCTFDSVNNKVIIVGSNEVDDGRAVAATIDDSDNSISFGTVHEFTTDADNSGSSIISVAYDVVAAKCLVVFRSDSDTKGYAQVLNVDGTTITSGTAVIFNNAATEHSVVSFDASIGQCVVAYVDQGTNSDGVFKVATIDTSDNSVSFSNATIFNDQSTDGTDVVNLVYDSGSERTIIVYSDDTGAPDEGTVIVATIAGLRTNLTTENFIGFSNAVYATGQTATIEVGGGVNNGQSSLTIGQQYFVQEDSTIDLTADSTSVIAGTAVSATDIIVKG